VLKPGGIACVNIGDATRSIGGQFQLFSNHSRIISSFTASGFQQLPTIIWRKPTNAPTKFMGSGMLPPSAYVTLEHEYILIFRKGTKRAFTEDHEKQERRKSAYFWEERNIWFSDIWTDLRGTAQLIDSDGGRRRSGAFPLELPYRLVNMFSLIGDTVLDPFIGTGTTMLAAMCAARNSIGFESDDALQSVILEKIASAHETSSLLVRERLQAHAIFVHQRSKSRGALKYYNTPHGFPVMTRHEEALRLETIKNLHYASNNRFNVVYEPFSDNRNAPTSDMALNASDPQSPRRRIRTRQLKLF
jgi:DNA modification methylase